MTDETIVAVFDTATHAEAAIRDLKAANVPESAVSRHAKTGALSASATAQPAREQGFWSSVFGGEPDHNTAVYDRSIEEGATVVTVKVPEARILGVTQILERHNPIDIDERATGYGLTQTTTTTRTPLASAALASNAPTRATDTGGDTIQLAEESLVVSKRLVNRGGTRIRRFVVETPVEEKVTLRDEIVNVDRHPVKDGRVVTDADFTDKIIEMTEVHEEAVVGKTARVVEEISLRKEVVDRVETIHETLRKEDVEIEQIPGETPRSTATTPVMPAMPRASKV